METLVVVLPTTPDEWASINGADLDAIVRTLNIAERRIEAALVGAVDHADRSAHHHIDGHRTTTSWLMATTNSTRGEATARVRTAAITRTLTTTAQELIAGRVGVAQIREIARLAANPRCGDQIEDSEQVLLEAAQTLEYSDFRVVTRRWEQLADADGAHRQHDRAHQHRNARVSFDGASFRFETSHGVIQGESMRTVFDAFCQAEFDRDWEWVKQTHGDQAEAALLPRSAAQRRADAFTAMVLAAATAGTGDNQPITATVNLIADLDTFEQHVNSQIVGTDVGTDIDAATVRQRRCETTGGIPVDPHQLVAAAMIGRIRVIVTDRAGIIVQAGRKRSLFTGALREAIQAIDPVCGWLGCNLRAQISAIDHLQPRSRGGPTDAANAKIMCDKHNLFKHTANYHIERTPTGALTITRPNGTKLRPPDAA